MISNAWLFFCLVMGIRGILSKFVDHYHGFGILTDAASGMETFFKCARAFLGDSAINDDKTVRPTKTTDVPGWEFDLTNEVCYPNQKGCNKLLVVFFCFDVKKQQYRELWEVLAGVAERYSAGLVGLRTFVSPFHHMKEKCVRRLAKSGRPRSGAVVASSSALFCIEMWRSEALLL